MVLSANICMKYARDSSSKSMKIFDVSTHWVALHSDAPYFIILLCLNTGVASAIYPGRQYKFQIITIIHFFYEHDIICIATPYNIRTRQNIWIRQILQSMNTTNFALLTRVYCTGYASVSKRQTILLVKERTLALNGLTGLSANVSS